MSRIKVQLGDTYKCLTVIERVENEPYGNSRWRCKCDCGNMTVAYGSRLRAGSDKSCGHLRGEYRKLSDGEASFNALYSNYIANASKRDLQWGLDKKLVRHLTSQSCYYCGKEPAQHFVKSSFRGEYIYNGLDRLDNTIGYLPDNVVPCCKLCNFAKRDLPFEEFIGWIKQVYTNLKLANT